MAQILGNELLIKALGKKGWRDVRRVLGCVRATLCLGAQTAQGDDTSQTLSVAPEIHTSRNETFTHSYTLPVPFWHVSLEVTGGDNVIDHSLMKMSLWGVTQTHATPHTHTHTSIWPYEESTHLQFCSKWRLGLAPNNCKIFNWCFVRITVEHQPSVLIKSQSREKKRWAHFWSRPQLHVFNQQ